MRSIEVGVVTEKKGAHLREYFAALAETQEVTRVTVTDASGESFGTARGILKSKLTGEFRSDSAMLVKAKPEMVLISMEPVNTPPAIEKAKGVAALFQKAQKAKGVAALFQDEKSCDPFATPTPLRTPSLVRVKRDAVPYVSLFARRSVVSNLLPSRGEPESRCPIH